MVIHWIVWEQEWEKFILSPDFLNLMVVVRSIPLFVISKRFIKINDFLDHLFYMGVFILLLPERRLKTTKPTI